MRKTKLVVVAVAIVGVGLASWTPPAAASAGGVQKVLVVDRCDPETFNEAVGEGTCVPTPTGDVTFDEFLQFLNPRDFGHRGWRFVPIRAHITEGTPIVAINTGGEFHTYTEVPHLGAGCVDFINQALGLKGAPVVDCDTAFATTALPPGGTLTVENLPVGNHQFMCMIHPWMRQKVEVLP